MEKKESISSVLMPLLLIALLVSPTIALYLSPTRAMMLIAMHGRSASILMDLGFMFFQFCLFLSPAFLFYRNIKVYVYLFFPLFLLAPVAVLYTLSSGANISAAVLGVIKESNYREITEFLGGSIVIVILAILVYLLFFVLIVKKIPKVYPPKALFAVSAVSILVVYVTSDMFQGRQAYPFYLIKAARNAINEINKINRHQELTRNFSFNAYKKDQLNQREVYVLILGESARYDHWAINGYGRNTSPRLSLRSNLISYSNVSTGAPLTRYSVPIILTRATASDFNRNYSEKSLISAFKEAGFKTYWISNQLTLGWHETNVTLHAKDADQVIFTNKSGTANTSTEYDEKIVTIFERIMEEAQANIFVVLHPMGSHYKYSLRYPDEFDIFKPSTSKLWLKLKKHKDPIINSYDNSILYADSINDRVIEVLNKYNLISYVMYISDHGQNLFDDAKHLSGRQITKYVLHVPLFVWTSDSYNYVYPEKKENIFANRNKAVSTDNIFYSILDMSNIGFDGQDFSRSVANGAFQPTQRTFIGPGGRVMDSEAVLER